MAPADEVQPEKGPEFVGETLSTAALARLEAIGIQLDAVSVRLQEVSKSNRATRRLAVGLAVSLVLDVLLTVTVTLLSLSALSQGASLHQSQLAACAIGNDSRSEQQALWSYLFELSGGARTPQQKEFLTYVDKTFKLVDCNAVYKQ